MRVRPFVTGPIRAALLVGALALGSAAPAAGSPPPATRPAPADIKDQLAAIPGMQVTEGTGTGGYRLFRLVYRQPVDHGDPSRGTFGQRATLLHKDVQRPMVLHTSGYWLMGDNRSEPAAIVDGNQLSTEQRFFENSTPSPKNWADLSIAQAAGDHHRFVTALKPIYAAKWLSTGASKGGMTSVYHRRFHPGDIDATIAYVAPNDVDNDEDSAYTRFFAAVGDATCRQRLTAVMKAALGPKRTALAAKVAARAQSAGETFDQTTGSADASLELAVVDGVYAFWQYKLASDCARVPAGTASDTAIYQWLDGTAGFANYTDQGGARFVTYYYQAGTQLGYPVYDLPELAGLLKYPDLAAPRTYVPRSIPMPAFDRAAMPDIDGWVRESGTRMMFVYGQNDPWSAEPFRVGSGNDAFVYEVKGGNHGATIGGLAAADRSAAQAAVRRWAGVSLSTRSAFIPGLDGWTPLTDDPRRQGRTE
ncbi:tripeptidyl aminopeptidase [Pilimelia anulata]|uniref:Tripeptidyl aminopeptidase n=1 Tax=Pilimelia anulata TaxID=53371 RepID=A0A8J3BBE0_9ACTN|nr:S28 family serine protease [Pilimelia anulata]GGK08138.1 tripeptidyl aminopeptidase [Pilimelia anulata]